MADIDDHKTPSLSLPLPPPSPQKPFWMSSFSPRTIEDELQNAERPRPREFTWKYCPKPYIPERETAVKATNIVSTNCPKDRFVKRQPEPVGSDNQSNVLFLYAAVGFSVVILSVLLAHYYSSLPKIDHLRSIIHSLEAEKINLQYRYTDCRKVVLAYNAQKQATDAAAAAALAEKQIADQQIAKQQMAHKETKEEREARIMAEVHEAIMRKVNGEEPEFNEHDDEEIGQKVWSSDGFVLQTEHLPPKKEFKHEDLCDKKIRDDLFSEYTSEYCEKVRQSKHLADDKRAPLHTHQPRADVNKDTAPQNNEPIFIEDFIDPNKFNPNTYQIEGVDSGLEEDNEFEYDLQEPMIGDVSLKDYDSFEGALLKLDEHMERISFHTNSCYTKYKKFKEDEERKEYKKFDKSRVEKSKKKYKEKDVEKKVKRRDEKRNERKDEKRDKRKYNDKEKNFKRN